MALYKIINITETLNKRDGQFNKSIDIEYVDNMIKKSFSLKPNEIMYLQISSLPTSLHLLRSKKLINVIEISQNEFNNAKNPPKNVKIQKKDEHLEENANSNNKKIKKESKKNDII